MIWSRSRVLWHVRGFLALGYCSCASGFVFVNSRSTVTRCSSSIGVTSTKHQARPIVLLKHALPSQHHPRGQLLSPWYSANRNRKCSSKLGASSTSSTPLGQDSSELFDVYLPPASLSILSEPPKPAGFTKRRGLVHAEGDWHRSVHIWLHNSKGELVIQKRSASKDTFPGMWDVSVGGHFTAGEGSLETAVKETREELGIDCDERDLRFVCTVPTSSTGSTALHGKFICNEFKDLYLMRYDGPLEGLKFSPDEVDEVKLIPINDLRGVYAREDPQYIIRPVYYVDALVAALKDALGSA